MKTQSVSLMPSPTEGGIPNIPRRTTDPMPDPVLWFEAMGLAALVSFATLMAVVWPGRGRVQRPAALGPTTALALGIAAGCAILGIHPRWPLAEDQDRLLAIVLPMALGVELATAFARPRWLAWTGRLLVVGLTGRILLHGSSYITDLVGPGSREWPPGTAATVFAGLAAAQLALWFFPWRLALRTPDASHTAVLAIVTFGTALVVMLSGYATGGLIGLPIAAALAGFSAAELLMPRPACRRGPFLAAATGLTSLLMIGRFFGELATPDAILLGSAPLLGWLPELVPTKRLSPRARASIRITLAALLVSAVVAHAGWQFARTSY